MIRQVSTITLRHLSYSRGQQHHQRLLHSSTSSSKHQNCTAAICLASFIAVTSAITATGAAEKGNGQQHSQCYTPTSANNNNYRLNVVSKCEEAIASSSSSSSNIPSAPLPSPKPLTRLQRLVYPHSYLPTPRLLTSQDTVFSYPQLTRGLIQRQKDEERLRNLLSSTRVVKLRTNNNNQEKQQQQQQQQQQQLLQEMNTIIYGAGITSQVRQEFVIQFGCTGYTPDILHHLVTNYANRGIIEIGAGHGQWARALHDYHHQKMNDGENNDTTATATNEERNSNNNGGQHPNRQTRHQTRHSWMLHTDKFIVAYDNKESLPLSSSMSNTNNSSSAATAGLTTTTTTTTVPPPTQEEMKAYFFNNVHTVNNIEAVTKYAHGRVLLLVYPPPVHAYINATTTTTTTTNSSTSNHHPNRKHHHHHNQYHDDNESSSNNSSGDWRNDIVIYVGEGRGGANANDEFFDYFLGTSNTATTTTTTTTTPTTTDNNDESSINSSWVLEKVMTVKSCPGGKGYEKLFILRRV